VGTADVENAKAGRLEHDVRRLGGAAAEEFVTAVGHDMSVDRLGQDVPFTFTVPRANSAVLLSSAATTFRHRSRFGIACSA